MAILWVENTEGRVFILDNNNPCVKNEDPLYFLGIGYTYFWGFSHYELLCSVFLA